MSKRTESPRGKAPGRDRDRKEAERRRQTRRRIRKIVERRLGQLEARGSRSTCSSEASRISAAAATKSPSSARHTAP